VLDAVVLGAVVLDTVMLDTVQILANRIVNHSPTAAADNRIGTANGQLDRPSAGESAS